MQKRRAGGDVIDLGMGNPSDPPAGPGDREAGRGGPRPATTTATARPTGIPNLRREVASKYLKKYGVRLDPESEVIVCLGSKEGFSHMCLALMGPGDTAIVPAPYFPVHVYAVALAAGNVIALEVADSEKFLSNIAYTCQHLYPQAEAADRQLSAQSVDGHGRAGVLRRGGEAGQALRLHGDQRLRLRRRGVRRLPAAELPGRARGARTWASSSPR